MERAWRQAGLSPATVGLIEGHGTSTRVGDVVEVESLMAAFAGAGLAPGSVPLGSVKSNIGHLKSAAGGAGMLKAVLALRDKVLPPSLHFDRPNPAIDFEHAPFHVNTELAEWKVPAGGVRRVGVSAFGFGGTNFHAVLDEYVPGAHGGGPRLHAGVELPRPAQAPVAAAPVTGTPAPKAPPRGALVLGAASAEALAGRLATLRADAEAGRAPARAVPPAVALHQPERIAIDYGDAAELASKARAGSSRPPPAVTPRPGSCCAPWACSVARAPPPRWPSSTPARAPSTSTCWPSCARPSRWWARPSTRRTASWPRCSAGR